MRFLAANRLMQIRLKTVSILKTHLVSTTLKKFVYAEVFIFFIVEF